jgi:hypothetical protein
VQRGVRVHAELGPLRARAGVVALGEHALAAAVLEPALPRDHEPARVRSHGRPVLATGRVRVDAELASGRRARGAVPLPEYADAVVARASAGPRHDHVAVVVRRHGGVDLAARGVRVDQQLAAPARARGAEELRVHGREAAVLVALPHHDEVAVHVRGHRWTGLAARDVRVHHELGALWHARRVEPPRYHAGAVAVLADARPDHDEPAAGRARHGRRRLVVRRVRVDAELGAQAHLCARRRRRRERR